MKKIKLPFLVGGVLLLGVVAQSLGTSAPAPSLKDQIWIDHIPKDDRDMMDLLVLLTDPDDPKAPEGFGIIAERSQWKATEELFFWKDSLPKIILDYPQTDTERSVAYKVWKCSENGFELCLDFGGKRYYSLEDWVVEGAASPKIAMSTLRDWPVSKGL